MAQSTRKRKNQRPKRSKPRSTNTAVLELQDAPINILEVSRRVKQKKFPASGPQRKGLDMTWDDVSLGAGSVQTRDGLLDERDRKDTYYKVFIANQWVSGCVDVIAKRITSGGWKCVEAEDGKGSAQNEQRIKDLLKLENLEEDFVQLLNSIATDLEIFGEAFCELVYDPSGNLVNLCMIDCVSMTTFFDKHGNVTGYKQTLEKSLETVWFDPHEIIRWWLPDPRAKKKALSPIEKLKDPVYLQQSMVTWQEKFFKQGGKPAYSVEMGPDSNEDDADRWLLWYKENYLGIQNAHVPPTMYGGGKIVEFGKGSIDVDYDKGEDKQRLKIIVVYGVPPAQLSIIESGNLGGGTGEDQNKAFINNTITPLANIILEKFNYRVLQKAMNIYDWKITTQYADYRNDTTVTEIEDKQIRNGSLNIDEARAEHGRTPVQGGSENVIVTSKDVTPVSRFGDLADEQKQSSQLDIETKKAQVDKLKQPPPPPPVIVQPGQHPADQQQDNETKEDIKRYSCSEEEYDTIPYIPPSDSIERQRLMSIADPNMQLATRLIKKIGEEQDNKAQESYNPDQPRDSDGRWGSGGGGSSSADDDFAAFLAAQDAKRQGPSQSDQLAMERRRREADEQLAQFERDLEQSHAQDVAKQAADQAARDAVKPLENHLAENGGKEWEASLSNSELRGIETYTDQNFGDIQDALRNGGDLPYHINADDINAAQNALMRSTAPDDMLVYRAINGDVFSKLEGNEGRSFVEKGFSSTTLNERYANQFYADGNYGILRVQVPKGSSGAYVDGIATKSGQQEYLIPHGSQFKILNVYTDSSGVRTADVQYTGQSPYSERRLDNG
jgi:HK97 family phage portal protein